MPFILSDHFILQFSSLRKAYEGETSIDLLKAPQPYGLSLFLGSKDVKTRHRQISFIEQWIKHLNEELAEHSITGLRVLMGVGLYTLDQIQGTYTLRSGASAILVQLIHQAMGVTPDNPIDDDTKACCLLATQRYLSGTDRFEALSKAASTPITEKEWAGFSHFISTQCDALDKKYLSDYPITSAMMPLLAKPMEYAGYATGFVMGDMIGKSTELLPARYALTAVVGSCAFAILGPTSAVGAMMFAGRVLEMFCGISLAWVMGSTMHYVGKGVGFGVGMSLDLSWKLLYNACALIENLYHSYPKLTGTSLIDGHRIIDGVDLVCEDPRNPTEKNPALDSVDSAVEINVDDIGFTVTIDGKKLTFPWLDIKPPQMNKLENIVALQRELTLTQETTHLPKEGEEKPLSCSK